jgi:ABC-type phosphate transport system substrate-binding protein
MHQTTKLLAAAAISLSVLSTPAVAKDSLNIIGSRTIAPYAEIVGTEFMKEGFGKPEIVESNTSQAFKHFCRGVGALYPDLAMASRRIKGRRPPTARSTASRPSRRSRSAMTAFSWGIAATADSASCR